MLETEVIDKPKRKRNRSTDWNSEKDNVLSYLVKLKKSDTEISLIMQEPYSTVSHHRRMLGLKGNAAPDVAKRINETIIAAPKDRANPLEIAKVYIPGFNPETMCIHHQDNRLERITLTQLMRRVNGILKSSDMEQVSYMQEWLV